MIPKEFWNAIEVAITITCGAYSLAFVSYNMYRFFDWLHRDRE